jgi:iron complex outermembrane recepter protein
MPLALLDALVRRARAVVTLATLSVCSIAPVGDLGAQTTPHGLSRHIHGVVEEETTGRPVDGATIVVEMPGAFAGAVPTSRTLRADSKGRFDFRDLPAAVVRLQVRAVGFAPYAERIDLTVADRLLIVHLESATTRLSEVRVQADTLTERLSRVAATTSLDAATLAATRGQTLGETIKNLPGVAVIQFGPSVAKPVIRGLNSQRVLVMNAGLRQEDQQWGTEHAPNIDSFEASGVTVVRGAATVLYGADALGGVVRVDRATLPDSGGIRGDVAVNTFSNSRQGALSLSAEGGNLVLPGLGRVGYRARLTTRVAGNAGAPDYALSNTGFRELNGSVAAGVSRPWGTAEITASRFGTELGILRQAHVGNADDLTRSMTSPPADSAFTYGIGRPSQRVNHTTLRTRLTFLAPHASELEVVYGLQFNHRREYDNHGPLRFRDVAAFNLKLFSNSLDLRWTHQRWRGTKGTIGVSALAQGNQTLGKAFLIPGFDLWQGALYAQEELALGRLSLSGGLRGDAIAQTTIPYADQGIRSPAGTRTWRDFSGSVGAAYLLADGLDVAVRVARAWRPPTVNERYAQGVHHGTAQYELGNAALTPERSQGVEATIRYNRPSLQLEAASYANRIAGFMFLQPGAPVQTIRGAFPGYRYAQTEASLRGLELSGTWNPGTRWQFIANGTAVRGADRANGGPLFDMPADRLSLTARWQGQHARLGEWFVGTGTQMVRTQDGVPEGTVYTLPTAGYALLQLEAGSRTLALLGRQASLSVSVNNALDTRYRDYLSRYRLFVNDAGRDVVVRLTMPW